MNLQHISAHDLQMRDKRNIQNEIVFCEIEFMAPRNTNDLHK
mgnify:CR=1 FL=1